IKIFDPYTSNQQKQYAKNPNGNILCHFLSCKAVSRSAMRYPIQFWSSSLLARRRAKFLFQI
ncbi:hypothetical protein, partial [uncultured Campylobacter sp.]|uniref:hypothetical protein n=1 Tax=uncultured Campylobacter sp. TaxID=218934 RepID=UPI0026322522